VIEDVELLEPELLIEIETRASDIGDKLEQPYGRYGFFY
jgi:hypothetical protein